MKAILLPVNLQQGLILTDTGKTIIGAYSHHNEKVAIHETYLKMVRQTEIKLPQAIQEYYVVSCGHLTVGYWDFDEYKDKEL